MSLLAVLVVICSNGMAKSSSSQVLVEEQGTSGSQGVVPAKTMGDSFILGYHSYLSQPICIV
jgi:hypothetical protein